MSEKEVYSKVVEISSPGGLSMKELAAFRLGALRMLIAAADGFGHEIPGLIRQSFENEIAYREHQLEEPEELF